MNLTNKQNEGLKIAIKRYKDNEKYTVISGFAGSGKSTLVSHIIRSLPVKESRVAYASYTGKAAEVLRKKGNPNATTLHKLLYISTPKPTGGFIRKRREHINYDVIVVDECSMVPVNMVNQLCEYPNVYIIFLGDPFQLPPINKKTANHLLDNPHCFLTEIMRQAQESDIIKVSMDIRNGKNLQLFKGNDIQILPKSAMSDSMLQWGDQVIVATNKTRKAINDRMREALGFYGDPKDGDKVICYRNYWEDECGGGNALVNGTTGYLKNCYSSMYTIPASLNKGGNGERYIDILVSDFIESEGELYTDLAMDKHMIITGDKSLDWKTEYAIGKNARYRYLLPYEFTYGYAITAHKAQGSQWDNIVVIEERFPFSKEEHARWLYTAITRASKKVVLLK